ncbi:WavE lipopolysaccharide synthesis family protein [Paracidovorax cattleyae]|uniref:WavE lipopolysaccharide synthesis n=1 Tax=Paracidovorax cattleyae TaxID=80868 RepID=A0A1H0TR18_9BURK|nr:WavE lipopolysaccharide synthesis family protein [Paracidovorax cattleyae]AVS75903.1 hypothetical protein C8240_19625 [Paracidovorax cattleyae]SDP56291.1 WavE lipopolysaccharide synthesis [Paracidovorax cattleyae]
MAKVRGGLDRVLLKYPDIDLSRIRLIGWGGGQAFTDYYPLLGLPVEYTVCPFAANQGKQIHGVTVKSPEALMQEPHDDVLVVVFAAHSAEIMNQIRNFWGDYRCVPALTHSPRHGDIDQLQAFARVFEGLSIQRTTPHRTPSLGIFVQGPVFSYTPMALAWQRMAHPEAYVCLVTWEHQSAASLDACRPWVDAVLTLHQPEAMVDSRNAIIRSAKAGALHLSEVGVPYAVRMRSDTVITGSLYRTIEELFDDGSRNAGKFGFLAHSSWKQIPFHFSERFLVSRTEDMCALWSLPEDMRGPDQIRHRTDEHYQQIQKAAVECLLWQSLARQWNEPARDLADGYRFAANHLVPMDEYADVLSFKNIPLFNLTLNKGFVGTPDWWREVYADLPSAMRQADAESAQEFTIAEFFAGRVG